MLCACCIQSRNGRQKWWESEKRFNMNQRGVERGDAAHVYGFGKENKGGVR